MTKLLDSDWPTAEQSSVNTVQTKVIVNSMHFTHGILAFDWVLVQFGNNLHSFHFQKAQIAFDLRAHAIEKSN